MSRASEVNSLSLGNLIGGKEGGFSEMGEKGNGEMTIQVGYQDLESASAILYDPPASSRALP